MKSLHDLCLGVGDDTSELSKALDSGVRLNETDESGRTVLQVAAYWGNINQVKILLEAGADPNSALKDAVFSRKARVLQTLIDFGADAEAVDEDGRSLLHSVCESVSLELIEVLLDAGLDPNLPDVLGITPLHLCTTQRPLQMGDCRICRYENLPVPYDFDVWRDACELLLSCGAKPDACDNEGATPLHKACERGSLRAGALMVACGADFEAKNRKGVTPLSCAKQNGHEGNAALVQELRDWPLHLAAIAGGQGLLVPRIRDALPHGFCRTHEGYTALHYAAHYSKYVFALLALIEAGENVDARDPDGDTPLHIAAENGHSAQVAAFLNGGADMHSKNVKGLTPLGRALEAMADKGIDVPNGGDFDEDAVADGGEDETREFFTVVRLLGRPGVGG